MTQGSGHWPTCTQGPRSGPVFCGFFRASEILDEDPDDGRSDGAKLF